MTTVDLLVALSVAFPALAGATAYRLLRFRELWARRDIVAWDTEVATLHHPVAGDLRLHTERLDLPEGAGQSLFVFHPAAGSDDADRLAALLSTSASVRV